MVVGVVVGGGVVAGCCAGVVGTRGEGFAGWWLVVAGEVAVPLVVLGIPRVATLGSR